jgi:hypothetical protein
MKRISGLTANFRLRLAQSINVVRSSVSKDAVTRQAFICARPPAENNITLDGFRMDDDDAKQRTLDKWPLSVCITVIQPSEKTPVRPNKSTDAKRHTLELDNLNMSIFTGSDENIWQQNV